jgi:hypothetical protein
MVYGKIYIHIYIGKTMFKAMSNILHSLWSATTIWGGKKVNMKLITYKIIKFLCCKYFYFLFCIHEYGINNFDPI